MREATGAAPSTLSHGYRRYALWVLLLIYVLNFLDRQIVTILAEPIKQELGLTDWQLGMMTGLAFAIFYTVLGIPIARYAERGNRPYIIGAAVAAWSLFTVLCGFAQNFWQLVLARIGVGIGEAGCTPPAHSLISDYVPREKRASALAFYSLGTPIGALLGMAMGGLIADAWGWRMAFLVAGAPGILMALVAAFTLAEPRKQLGADFAAKRANGPSFKDALAEIRGKKTFWFIAWGVSIKAFIGYGSGVFIAPFFFRNHGPELTEIAARYGLGLAGFLGLALGVVVGVTGAIGIWLGGQLADRFGGRDLRHYMGIPAISTLTGIPIYLTALFVESAMLAIVLMAIPPILNGLWYGPAYAAIQGLVNPETRATATAIMLFIVNLVGLGMGPLLVGALSDLLSGPFGLGPAQGVRWSLAFFTLFGVVASALFWMARRTIREEMVS